MSKPGAHSDNVTVVANQITVDGKGHYSISYSVYPTFTTTAPTLLTFAVRYNNTVIPETVGKAAAPAATFNASFTGSSIVDLPVNAVVDIVISSTTNATMSFDEDSTSSLIVYKLD